MRLRKDFCLGGLMGLPCHSKGWRHNQFEQLIVLREHGYEGVVHWGAWADIRRAGLVPCGMARIRQPAEAIGLAHAHQDEGLDFTTLHAGTGFESDADMDRLASAIIDASSRTGYALHVETHRATMTQDIKRTIDLVSRFPDLPITLDFSHWYTGHELTYGDEYGERLASVDPIFANVRSIQLRIGSTGRIQTPFDAGSVWCIDYVAALDRCFGLLDPQLETISCAPELLPAKTEDGRWICYGEAVETSDRFDDALSLSQLAENRLLLARSHAATNTLVESGS